MSTSFDLGPVRVFTTGTVGAPGKRVFYIQMRSADEQVTLKCEKQQVLALAEYLERLLADLPDASAAIATLEPLAQPVVAEWTIGTLGLGYDRDRNQIMVIADELVIADAELDADDDDEPIGDEPAGARAQFSIDRDQAAAFIAHAREVAAAGRPTCFLCLGPMDPDGHACPRLN